ncbi:hypothetical protein HDU76_003377, partial [Blyttiomyces sp. JEL0837]
MTIDAAAFVRLVHDFDNFKSWCRKHEGEVKVLNGEVQYWKHKAKIQEGEVQRLKVKGDIQEEVVHKLQKQVVVLEEKSEIQEGEVQLLQEQVVVLEGRASQLEVQVDLKSVGEIVGGGVGGFGGGVKMGGSDFDIEVESGSGSGDSTVRGSTNLSPEGGGFAGVLNSEQNQHQELSSAFAQSYPHNYGTQQEQFAPDSSISMNSARSYSRGIAGPLITEQVDDQVQQQQQQQQFTMGSNYVNAPPASHMTSTTPSSLVLNNDRSLDYSQTATAAQPYSEPLASSSTLTVPPPPPTATNNNNNNNYDNTAAETTAEAFWDSFSPSSDLSVPQPEPMTSESHNGYQYPGATAVAGTDSESLRLPQPITNGNNSNAHAQAPSTPSSHSASSSLSLNPPLPPPPPITRDGNRTAPSFYAQNNNTVSNSRPSAKTKRAPRVSAETSNAAYVNQVNQVGPTLMATTGYQYQYGHIGTSPVHTQDAVASATTGTVNPTYIQES